jgi:hypothetical protein
VNWTMYQSLSFLPPPRIVSSFYRLKKKFVVFSPDRTPSDPESAGTCVYLLAPDANTERYM